MTLSILDKLNRPIITAIVGLLAGPLYAQLPIVAHVSSKDQPSQVQSPTQSTTQIQDKSIDPTQQSRNVTALDGSGVISMTSIRQARMLIGGAVSGGFDSNPLNLSNGIASTIYAISPYIGLEANTGRTQYLLQYHPTFNRSSGYAETTMHLASMKVIGSFNERWNWTMGVTGNHGPNSLFQLAPSTGTNIVSYRPNAGTQTNIDGGFDLYYNASPRDSIGLHFGNSYNSLQKLGETSRIASANLVYTHSVKSTFSLLAYEQSARYYGDLKCITFGVGGGFRWHAGENTVLSLSGGPQLNTSDCRRQQGFSYNTSISRKLPQRSQLYLLASREPVSGTLGSGLWQDGISGGYQRQVLLTNVVSFDLGFVHSSTLENVASYHGTYYNVAYSRPLKGGLNFGFAYRSFIGNSGGSDFSRNTAMVSLSFSPNTRNTAR